MGSCRCLILEWLFGTLQLLNIATELWVLSDAGNTSVENTRGTQCSGAPETGSGSGTPKPKTAWARAGLTDGICQVNARGSEYTHNPKQEYVYTHTHTPRTCPLLPCDTCCHGLGKLVRLGSQRPQALIVGNTALGITWREGHWHVPGKAGAMGLSRHRQGRTTGSPWSQRKLCRNVPKNLATRGS